MNGIRYGEFFEGFCKFFEGFYEGVSSIFDLITKKLCDVTAKPVRLIKDN